MLFSLKNKVALITGGSRGLGLKMAEGLGQSGASIVITARKVNELEEAQKILEDSGIEVMTIPCDLGNLEADSHKKLTNEVLERYGQIDILVNNAGTGWQMPAEEVTKDAWNKVLRLNVDAVFLMCQEVGIRSMIPRRSGKIINIASIMGLGGVPPYSPLRSVSYNTSKAAVINMTRALACEWGQYNININSIAPGFFPTKMTDYMLQNIHDQIISETPLGRLGGEDDMKGVAVFLASDASKHITGQVIVVDGGASARY